jgi:hypothetical protein
MAEQHIRGLKELNDFLQKLPVKLEKNILRGAFRAGAKEELLPEVQANLMSEGAVRTGAYIAGLKVGTRSRGGKVTAYVKASGPHAYLGKWLEYGTRAHNIAAKLNGFLSFMNIFVKEVAHPGTRPRPHMRPALDHSGGAAVNAAARYMREKLASKHGLDTSGVMLEGDE